MVESGRLESGYSGSTRDRGFESPSLHQSLLIRVAYFRGFRVLFGEPHDKKKFCMFNPASLKWIY